LLQLALVGIGRIPNCVLNKLKNRRDLGIHSEMISDPVIRLFKTGQVTNARKVQHFFIMVAWVKFWQICMTVSSMTQKMMHTGCCW